MYPFAFKASALMRTGELLPPKRGATGKSPRATIRLTVRGEQPRASAMRLRPMRSVAIAVTNEAFERSSYNEIIFALI